MRAALAAIVVLSHAFGGAADPVSDADRSARRGRDRLAWDTTWDDLFGHNHFHLSLFDYREDGYVRRYPGLEGELRATVSWVDEDGATRIRRFSNVEREGYEPFSEGPLCCSFYEGVLVALPPDFGGVSATIDFWAALPDIPEQCPPLHEPGPCGGATEGYFNPASILLVTDPFALDAADSMPWRHQLN